MIAGRHVWWLAPLGVMTALAGCSRAALHAVTDGDGGAGGGGDTASLGCRAVALPPGDTTRSVQVGSLSRTYVLHLPPTYDGHAPAPLVVDFHGIGGTGASERAMSPYPATLDPAGAIMAFPDGLKGPAGTAWNVGPCCVADVDDVAFARALVADVGSAACVAVDRTYAVGVLTGGGMAHYLACRAADVFAAVAPAAFDLLAENVNDCLPQRAVTEVSFRGTADPRVPYQGGPSSLVPGMPITFLGAADTFTEWAQLDGCTGSPAAADANGCARYATCHDGVEVVLCTQQGGGDDPGDPAVAWLVLMRHTL